MSESQSGTFELKESQIQYLDAMVKKHDLPNRSKALRILITFAMQSEDQEESIFSDIRCTSC